LFILHRFEDLVDQFLQVCDGLPLALKELGALLFGKPESYWDAKLNESKVQMEVSPDIKKRLKISYDALSEEEQKIFLDIAFFFIGIHRKKQNKCHNSLERIRLERIAGA